MCVLCGWVYSVHCAVQHQATIILSTMATRRSHRHQIIYVAVVAIFIVGAIDNIGEFAAHCRAFIVFINFSFDFEQKRWTMIVAWNQNWIIFIDKSSCSFTPFFLLTRMQLFRCNFYCMRKVSQCLFFFFWFTLSLCGIDTKLRSNEVSVTIFVFVSLLYCTLGWVQKNTATF